MDAQWKNVKDQPPKFGQRVLIFDYTEGDSDRNLKCATYESKKESERGIEHQWQVENELSSVRSTLEWWTELPTNEPLF